MQNKYNKYKNKLKYINNTAAILSCIGILPGSVGIAAAGIEISKWGAVPAIVSGAATAISSGSLLAILVMLGICQTERQYTKMKALEIIAPQYKTTNAYYLGAIRTLGHIDNGAMLASGTLLTAAQLHWKILPQTIGGMGISSVSLIGLAAACLYKAIEALWTSILFSKTFLQAAYTIGGDTRFPQRAKMAKVLANHAAAEIASGIKRAFAWGGLSVGFGVAVAIKLGLVAFANPITGPALLVGLFIFVAASVAYTFFSDRPRQNADGKNQRLVIKKDHYLTRAFLYFFTKNIEEKCDITLTDADSDSDSNANANANADADSDSNANADPDADADANANANANANADPDADADADADANIDNATDSTFSAS